jgi:hypothetical protein
MVLLRSILRASTSLFFFDPECGEMLGPMNRGRRSGMARTDALLVVLAIAILLTGVLRFLRFGHFTFAQAGYCLLATLAAMLLLFILDYTMHHARTAALAILIMVGLLAVTSPAFCVGLGFAGTILLQRRRAA